MATRAFVRQEVIDGGRVDVSDVRCPNCGTNTLVLSGQAQIPQREVMEEGQITGQLPGRFEDGAFDLQQIDCMTCNTQFIIKDHELCRLEQENLELRQKLAIQEGRPPDGGYVN